MDMNGRQIPIGHLCSIFLESNDPNIRILSLWSMFVRTRLSNWGWVIYHPVVVYLRKDSANEKPIISALTPSRPVNMQ